MRPATGVAIELLALTLVLGPALVVPPGLPFALYVVLVQLLATYLIHCPAHYVVGTVLGIRFRAIRLGKSTLARGLPPRLAGLSSSLPVVTLSTEKSSLARASRREVAAMYASGTVASVGSAIVIAAAATIVEAPTYSALAWGVALLYLFFDAVFSPRSGDLARARSAAKMLPS